MSQIDPDKYDDMDKFYDKLQKIAADIDADLAARDELYKSMSPQKLISCRHEIVFDITANVLQENEEGEVIGTTKICRKNYHIPVPADKDYDEYMVAFFDYLENCIANTASTVNQTQNKET